VFTAQFQAGRLQNVGGRGHVIEALHADALTAAGVECIM